MFCRYTSTAPRGGGVHGDDDVDGDDDDDDGDGALSFRRYRVGINAF